MHSRETVIQKFEFYTMQQDVYMFKRTMPIMPEAGGIIA